VVVNRAFARRYLAGGALGAQLPMSLGYGDDPRQATVIGVVDDVRYVMPGQAVHPEMYYSFRQLHGTLPVPVVTVVARPTGDASGLAAALRSAIGEVDRGLAPDSVMWLGQRIVARLVQPRLYATLVGMFAFLALVIAAVGLFGVLSYTVAQRSRELALRAALGAAPSELLRLVLRQGLAAAGAGVGAGALGSLVLARSISALVPGVGGADALTSLGATSLLLAAAVVACAAPARRAARLDPLRALRG
jgi:ABC-type antimicrobial peptide transport system permease subunit